MLPNFYLILGLDKKRLPFLFLQYKLHDLPIENINFILKPNKDDDFPISLSNNQKLTKGQIAIAIKHYLALELISKSSDEFGVIMEDNIMFIDSVRASIMRYIQDLPTDWDILFDSDIANLHYIEGPVFTNLSVYKKSLYPTKQCHGGSRGANFIMVKRETAKILIEDFFPITDAIDHHYNVLLRNHKLNSYWSEPPNVHYIPRPSGWKVY